MRSWQAALVRIVMAAFVFFGGAIVFRCVCEHICVSKCFTLFAAF